MHQNSYLLFGTYNDAKHFAQTDRKENSDQAREMLQLQLSASISKLKGPTLSQEVKNTFLIEYFCETLSALVGS
jgi:hypothetical protein